MNVQTLTLQGSINSAVHSNRTEKTRSILTANSIPSITPPTTNNLQKSDYRVSDNKISRPKTNSKSENA